MVLFLNDNSGKIKGMCDLPYHTINLKNVTKLCLLLKNVAKHASRQPHDIFKLSLRIEQGSK